MIPMPIAVDSAEMTVAKIVVRVQRLVGFQLFLGIVWRGALKRRRQTQFTIITARKHMYRVT